MTQGPEGIRVERARPPDAGHIAAFISRAWPQAEPVTRDHVIGHLGKTGLLMAKDGEELVGVLGFQAENLVARVTDFVISPASFRTAAGSVLLGTMEQMARELECEAAVLLVSPNVPPAVDSFWRGFGYEARSIADLPPAWREATRDSRLDALSRMLMKPLRTSQVTRPLG